MLNCRIIINAITPGISLSFYFLPAALGFATTVNCELHPTRELLTDRHSFFNRIFARLLTSLSSHLLFLTANFLHNSRGFSILLTSSLIWVGFSYFWDNSAKYICSRSLHVKHFGPVVQSFLRRVGSSH